MTVTFPLQSTWIPNQDQFWDTGSGLLNVIGAALDQSGRGQPYARRVVSHGEQVAWKLGTSPTERGQLLVCLVKVFMGKAGQENYQFDDGNYGRVGMRTMQWKVNVVNQWPTPRGGTSPRVEADAEIEAQTEILWKDGLIVLSALWALQLRGITTDPPVAPIAQDRILVGPMAPVSAKGGLAGWEIDVYIQM